MSDTSNSTPTIVVQECRPWVWIFVIVLSTLTGGMTGLYTGSYWAGQKGDTALAVQRTDYERRLVEQNNEHQQEITRMSANMVLLSNAVQALSSRVSSVSQTVGEVQDKVNKHEQLSQQNAAVAKQALKTAKLTSAKTEVLEAKVDKDKTTAVQKPAAPVSAPIPASIPAGTAVPLSPGWWHGSSKN